MSDLIIDDLTKKFGDTVALDGVSLTARDGELLTLLGPSGCGKSTTLWSIAGLYRPDSGTIRVGPTTFFDGGRTNLAPEARNCGVVFQSYAIWPHMTVADNVAYPLKLRKVGREQRRRRVAEMLELVELGAYADRFPHQLSGGQQQRVALARALSHPPELLLLDEPFSNLDAKLRTRAREWLRQLQRSIGITTVFVTHDQDEALSMSDRIVVMSAGRIHQVGPPEDIYQLPADRFVADFIGTTNFLDGTVTARHGHELTVSVPGLASPVRAVSDVPIEGPVTLSVRPEAITLRDAGGPSSAQNSFPVSIDDRAFLGDHYDYWFRLGETSVVAQTTRRLPDASAVAEIDPSAVRVFPREGAALSSQDGRDTRQALLH